MIDISLESLTSIFSEAMRTIKRWQFSTKAQLAFLEDLYALINDGIPANRAIEMMAQATRGLTRDVALSIAQSISEGQPLAEGMRSWFSINIVEIIRVGEEGGVLGETMKSAITALSQRSGALGTLISAMTYPLMVITIACIIIVYLNNSVFIQFRMIKPYEQWPAAGQDLVAIAQIIQSWWWLVILFVIAMIIIMRKIMENYVGEFRPFLDRIFPFSLYRRFVAARLMETMGLLVSNGVVFKNAVKVMQYQANPYLTSHLLMMEHLLGIGRGNIADMLATGLIDDADIMRLRVMGEVKGFEHGLTRMGIRGAEQGANTMKILARIVGGILLAIAAILIIIIVRGIYLTGMSMGSV